MAVQCEGDAGDRFSYGHSCNFSCSRGYRMRGPHTITCTAAAAWSQAVPTCEREHASVRSIATDRHYG